MPKSTTTGQASLAGGPFVEVQTKLYIHLPPCFVSKPIEGIHEQLNGFLMRYEPQFAYYYTTHPFLLWENATLLYIEEKRKRTHPHMISLRTRFRYMPQVDGVVLAHSDLKLLQTSGRIMYDSPYSHFWISVKLLVWRPVKGTTLCTFSSSRFILVYQTYRDRLPSHVSTCFSLSLSWMSILWEEQTTGKHIGNSQV
jgi:DNA-directed RNA polymerase I subunit RPA43